MDHNNNLFSPVVGCKRLHHAVPTTLERHQQFHVGSNKRWKTKEQLRPNDWLWWVQRLLRACTSVMILRGRIHSGYRWYCPEASKLRLVAHMKMTLDSPSISGSSATFRLDATGVEDIYQQSGHP